MRHLLIIGARGWGREVLTAATRTSEYIKGEYDIKGFLDDNSHALDGLRGEFPDIICPVETYEPSTDDIFFIALGDPVWRKHYAEIIEAKGGHFLTIVSPNANVLNTAKIGEGSMVCRWSNISDNVTVGRHSIIHSFCDIGHDAIIGDYGTLESYCFMGGHSHLGKCSVMHVKSAIIRKKGIGDNSAIGSGSVVIRNFGNDVHVYGNPAIKIDF